MANKTMTSTVASVQASSTSVYRSEAQSQASQLRTLQHNASERGARNVEEAQPATTRSAV
eukprot:1166269-Rhodomonas_salina.3